MADCHISPNLDNAYNVRAVGGDGDLHWNNAYNTNNAAVPDYINLLGVTKAKRALMQGTKGQLSNEETNKMPRREIGEPKRYKHGFMVINEFSKRKSNKL
jgi:hypothetical protein